MSEEEREYLNEMIRSLNNRLVDALRERDEARRYSCDLEARITMLEEDRRDTSNNFGTNPCSEIILPDYPLARDSKEIAKRKGWDCFKDTPVVKTLKGVVVSKGKALPPKFELGDDDK